MHKTYSSNHLKIIIGASIILIGGLQLLKNLGMDINLDIWDFWPVILIIAGLAQITKPHPYRHLMSGLILLVLGAGFLMNNLDMLEFDFSDIWPLILIILGVAILSKSRQPRGPQSSDQDFIDLSLIFYGGDFQYANKKLTGGRISLMMGGGSLDFYDSDMAGTEMTMDMSIFWGGLEIKTPKHWKIQNQVVPVLGGIENKKEMTTDLSQTKTLILKGSIFMGGIEIR